VLPESNAAGTHESVRGIVLPSTASPTLQTTAEGAAISWRRPAGARDSSSFALQRLVRAWSPTANSLSFLRRANLEVAPDGCCTLSRSKTAANQLKPSLASRGAQAAGARAASVARRSTPLRSRRSDERPPGNGVGPTLTISGRGRGPSLTFEHRGDRGVFAGRRPDAKIDPRGVTVSGSDSITLFGPVTSRSESAATNHRCRSRPRPPSFSSNPRMRFRRSAMERSVFDPTLYAIRPGRPRPEPTTDRCSACGTHPDSVADTDIYDCVPGNSVCYRCVSWECSAP
jgi:hypothetical protein